MRFEETTLGEYATVQGGYAFKSKDFIDVGGCFRAIRWMMAASLDDSSERLEDTYLQRKLAGAKAIVKEGYAIYIKGNLSPGFKENWHECMEVYHALQDKWAIINAVREECPYEADMGAKAMGQLAGGISSAIGAGIKWVADGSGSILRRILKSEGVSPATAQDWGSVTTGGAHVGSYLVPVGRVANMVRSTARSTKALIKGSGGSVKAASTATESALTGSGAMRSMAESTGLRNSTSIIQEFLPPPTISIGGRGLLPTEFSVDALAALRELEGYSGIRMSEAQRLLLASDLRATIYTRLDPASRARYSSQFTAKVRGEIISDWERYNGRKWPKYTEPVYAKDGKILKDVGNLWDAHHIIPQQVGGSHEWYNVYPLSTGSSHQGGVHGMGSALNRLLKGNK